MLSQHAVVPLLLVVSTALTLLVVYFVWQERPKAGATAIAVANVGVACWALGQAVVFLGNSPWLGQVGLGVTYVGMSLVAGPWLVFALQYTGASERVSRGLLVVLIAEPVLVLGLGLTNAHHELLWTDVRVTSGAAAGLTYGFGVGTWAHVAYCYGLSLAADWRLFRKFVASRNVYRTRTFLFIGMSASMILTSGLSVARLSPVGHFALTPLFFLSIAGLALALVSSNRFISALPLGRILGAFSSRSKSLAPVARNTAIEELDAGFIVLDHRNRVVDLNPMGRLILGRTDERVVGKDLQELLPRELFVEGTPGFLEATATGEFEGVWIETADGEALCFDVVVNPLTESEGFVGRVALVHDVTHRERRKQQLEERTRELERQNEQLDDFASIVSHDLRNPLNVARGHLSMVDADGDEASIETAETAMGRMEDIIDDVLALARSGQTVEETDRVSLATAAREAWANVDTETATLEVVTATEIEADESRLYRLLENIFRNAVEHGGSGVTVTVGDHETGFFVADDGPGVPEDQRQSVFDRGYSTSDAGTGFGLSIVRTIADAHGWDVTVGESADGGARFEFVGAGRPGERPTPLRDASD